MASVKEYKYEKLSRLNSSGILYACSQCDSQIEIRSVSSVITGLFIALIAGVVGIWAFLQGPYWYATHFAYFDENDFNFSFIILDLIALLFYCALICLALWLIWIELILPLVTIIRHPSTGENREKNQNEKAIAAKSTKMKLISFLVFPLLIYVPLFLSIWLLDKTGFDIRDNQTFKYIAMAGVFLGVGLLARRFKSEFTLIFGGMIFWMAIAVTAILYLE